MARRGDGCRDGACFIGEDTHEWCDAATRGNGFAADSALRGGEARERGRCLFPRLGLVGVHRLNEGGDSALLDDGRSAGLVDAQTECPQSVCLGVAGAGEEESDQLFGRASSRDLIMV